MKKKIKFYKALLIEIIETLCTMQEMNTKRQLKSMVWKNKKLAESGDEK